MSLDWKSLIGTVAPTIATALGGPFAGLATNVVCNAIGLPTGATDDQIAAKLQENQANLLAVQQADNEFKEKIAQLNVDLAKVNADHDAAMESIAEQDRASARGREVSLKDNTPAVLAGLITIGFFGTMYQVLVIGVAANVPEVLVGTLLGALGAAWTGVVNYYFGSSAGSDKKTELMAQK